MTRRPTLDGAGRRIADRGALASAAKSETITVKLTGPDVDRLRYLRGAHPDETDAAILRRALRAFARSE